MSEAVDRLLEQRRARHRWTRRLPGLAGAALLHVAIVAGLLFGPQLLAKPPAPVEYVPVLLLPAPALGSPNPSPPRAEPKPPPPEPEPISTPPPPPEEPPAMAAPEPAPVATATPKPRPPAPAPRATAAPAEPRAPEPQAPSTGPPGPRGAPGGSPESPFQASVGGVDNPNFTYGYYLDRMILMVAAQWVRPPLGSGIETVVHFRVLPDGKVEDLELRTSSGYNSFDLAAMRAVQSAAPLPPLPRSYREGDLGVTLIFR